MPDLSTRDFLPFSGILNRPDILDGMTQTTTAFGELITLKWTYDEANSLTVHSRKNPGYSVLTFLSYTSVTPAPLLHMVVRTCLSLCSPVYLPVLHLSLSHLETIKIGHILFVVAIGVPVRASLVSRVQLFPCRSGLSQTQVY